MLDHLSGALTGTQPEGIGRWYLSCSTHLASALPSNRLSHDILQTLALREFMKKDDLIRGLATMTGLSRREARVLVQTVIAVVEEALQRGEPVQIVGFGRFTVRWKPARMGRHMRTGEAIIIRPRNVVSFRASASLRRLMNRGST